MCRLRTGRMPFVFRLATAISVMLPFVTATAQQRHAGSPRPAAPPTRNASLVTALANDLRSIARLPGLSIAVLDRNEVVYADGVGFADIATGRRVDSSTVFGSASVAKIVTATAALRLAQNGRFDLDLPVARTFPDFPGGDRITPRQLAAHLGGIPHYGFGSMPSSRKHVWASRALDEFAQAPRVGEPGVRSVYSTHGITLLSAVMEQATQRPILDVLRTEVFEPFDMRSSGGLFTDSLPPHFTTMYERHGDSLRALPGPLNLSYSWAGAGLRHTPSDLVRMARPYFDGTFTPATLTTAFEPQRTRDGASTGLGFVWRVETDWRGRRLAHHAGVTRGTRAVLLLRRDEQRAIAVMTNLEWTSSIERTANTLAEALFDSAPRPAPLRLRGTWTGSVDSVRVQGAWSVDGDTGWIALPPVLQGRFRANGGVTAERLPVRAIRGDLYALVTPWGLSPMEVNSDANGRVHARVQVGSQWWSLVQER